jgi:GNAT superfamily N-acetyltransferase
MAPYTFLMPSPPEWIEAAREFHGERLELFPRTSFSAGRLSLERLGSLLARSAYKDRLEQLDTALAGQIWRGENHYLDISDFESGQDFIARGVGYCLRADGKIVGAAYSSLACSRGIEVSLYVEPEQRRKGVATALSCRLLSYCLERGMEPHWDAANIESCDLAEKLGYIRTGSYAAYYWIED